MLSIKNPKHQKCKTSEVQKSVKHQKVLNIKKRKTSKVLNIKTCKTAKSAKAKKYKMLNLNQAEKSASGQRAINEALYFFVPFYPKSAPNRPPPKTLKNSRVLRGPAL